MRFYPLLGVDTCPWRKPFSTAGFSCRCDWGRNESAIHEICAGGPFTILQVKTNEVNVELRKREMPSPSDNMGFLNPAPLPWDLSLHHTIHFVFKQVESEFFTCNRDLTNKSRNNLNLIHLS